jgi:hypothetical protein
MTDDRFTPARLLRRLVIAAVSLIVGLSIAAGVELAYQADWVETHRAAAVAECWWVAAEQRGETEGWWREQIDRHGDLDDATTVVVDTTRSLIPRTMVTRETLLARSATARRPWNAKTWTFDDHAPEVTIRPAAMWWVGMGAAGLLLLGAVLVLLGAVLGMTGALGRTRGSGYAALLGVAIGLLGILAVYVVVSVRDRTIMSWRMSVEPIANLEFGWAQIGELRKQLGNSAELIDIHPAARLGEVPEPVADDIGWRRRDQLHPDRRLIVHGPNLLHDKLLAISHPFHTKYWGDVGHPVFSDLLIALAASLMGIGACGFVRALPGIRRRPPPRPLARAVDPSRILNPETANPVPVRDVRSGTVVSRLQNRRSAP